MLYKKRVTAAHSNSTEALCILKHSLVLKVAVSVSHGAPHRLNQVLKIATGTIMPSAQLSLRPLNIAHPMIDTWYFSTSSSQSMIFFHLADILEEETSFHSNTCTGTFVSATGQSRCHCNCKTSAITDVCL